MHQGPPTNFGNSQPGNPTFFSPFANNLNAQTNTNVGGPPSFTNPTGFPQQAPFTPTPVGPPPVYNPTTTAPPPVYNPTASPPPVYNPNPYPTPTQGYSGPVNPVTPSQTAPPTYNPNQYTNPVSPPPTFRADQTAPPPIYNPNAQNPNVGTPAPPPVNYSPLSSISTGAVNTQTSPVGRYPPPISSLPQQQTQQPGNQSNAMKSPRGNEQKINPSQIPSPTNMDPNTVVHFNTRSNVAPPPVTVPFTVVDDGNASPRFMRMTLYNIPTTNEIYKNCNAPLGFALQPLAELGPNEEGVPLVNFGPSGPIRCIRCKAYINPFVIWSNGGRQYQCRLCDVVNDVPKEYFSPIEPSGKRYDHNSRPELSKGVVDFVASAEYIEKPPVAMSYLFAIDVSYSSVSSGLLQLIINSLRRVLNEFPLDNKIGIMTFDSTVHFYNLNPSLQNPQMLVVPDIDSVFLPLSEEVIFVKYSDCKANIDTLLDKLPLMFANSKVNDSSFGSAIEAATIAMKSNGGRVIAFQSVLPNIGQGRLVKRDDLKAYGTDKERLLYTPTEGFYTTKVKEFVKNKVSVDVFLCPPVGFVDVGTIGNLSRQTGGHVYFYPNFNVMKDGEKVQMDLIRNVTRESGYDGLLRVRTGRGLGVVAHHGNFSTSNQIELELAGIHSETSIFVELKHEEKLDEKQEVCIQTALLYTTSHGERRIRVFNMALPVTSVLGNVFRNADLDAIMNYYVKSNIAEVVKTPMTTLRSNLVERIVDVLYSYRKFCATSSSPGQLILPEALKLLPVFTLSLLKNAMMRPGTDVSPDERNYSLYLLYSLPPALSTPLLYPRMYALHTMSQEAGTADSKGHIKLPPLVRLSSDLLSQDAAFLLEDGQRMLLWIGKSLSPSFASELLIQDNYSSSFALVPPNYDVPDQFSTRLHNIINSIRQSHRSFEPLSVIKQGEVGEMKFFTYLVEDKGLDTMNYVDFLCHVHRQIQGKL